MRFINYSQNFEDIYLWRALKSVENGFYIDVGANDPIADSVTKAFYDKGWRGINIEPLELNLKALRLDRPNDINLGLAVGNKTGFITLYDTDVRGLATASVEIAESLRVKGHVVEEKKVEVSTLELICDEFVLDGKDINFLKVDVEGFEKDVLEGANFKKYRPWIVIVEATLPNTQILNFDAWEHILLTNDYKFVFFDGINRYYISIEKFDELSKAFEMPITVFDNYISWDELFFKKRVDDLNTELERIKSDGILLKNESELLKQENTLLTLKNNTIENELNGVYKSISWLITKPLRWLNSCLKFKNNSLEVNNKILNFKVAQYCKIMRDKVKIIIIK
ncbi:FkbM family methyltransferase, partial [Yersinia rohdei]|uniref:FkbM family methyltransferase n=1 Tax=Yersinia rohdei TaxID=29485 RepID=UPI00067D4448